MTERRDAMMRKKSWIRRITLLLALCSLVTALTVMVAAAGVVPSDEEYTLSFSGVNEVFFGNVKPMDLKAGKVVYLTYTVDKVRGDHAAAQHGVVATERPETRYPYDKGGVICYSDNAPILEEGCTYFFKFFYTKENGFEYVAAKAKGSSSQWVWFQARIGDELDDYTHCGIWFAGGNVSVKLTHVRCYDHAGNDLGIYAPKHKDTLLDDAQERLPNDSIDHRYSISINNAINVVISNEKQTSSDTVYMEYTVKESSGTSIYQNGLLNHHAPQKSYPHDGAGYMLYEMYKKPGQGYLLQEGASYVITFRKLHGQFLVLIQRTLDGKVEFKEFAAGIGTYAEGDPYYALWLGEGADFPVTCELVDFRCYDANSNNLGVQTNDRSDRIKIEHIGELEDYGGCEAVYYNAQSGHFIMLYSDQTAKVTRGTESCTASYKIKNDVLTLQLADGTIEDYSYSYQQFTDQDGNVYTRLGIYTVTFVTETEEAIESVTLNAEYGYYVAAPETPAKDGAEFMGWYLSDGTEFDFNSVVLESLTLYAKWSDDPVFQQSNTGSEPISGETENGWVVPGAVSVLILLAGAVSAVLILKKRK